MTLNQLQALLPQATIKGTLPSEIRGLSYDSRRIRSGDLFFAWKGDKSDGHQYLLQAVEKGAVGVVVEKISSALPAHFLQVEVKRVRESLARIASAFYGEPSRKMELVGVTGTNGKTTTAFLTKHLLQASGWNPGLIGTIRYEIGDRVIPASRTTPEGSDLQELFSQMIKEGSRAAVMEVSSHALDQGRVAGTRFQVVIFTNLTQDHLDYHGTMEKYFDAKLGLFTGLEEGASAVVNLDDPRAHAVLKALPAHVTAITVSAEGKKEATFSADKVVCHTAGTEFELSYQGATFAISTPLIGMFNVANTLCAMASVRALGVSTEEMIDHLADLPQVPGRLEKITRQDGLTVVVDYAHTEDALRKTLQTLRDLNPRKLIVVIGCGGNRDTSKRPKMARAAVELADLAIFTSDNPRNESATTILEQMEAGVVGFSHYLKIEDRREAIQKAIQEAHPSDLVCVAGKGHEITQEIGGRFLSFDDCQVVRDCLGGLS
ncbi:MAG: UDP-N-acetylmuramoyl-L-alanyl-D-glutamate--2,6-diaminopimelate ligase [Verrucomicrobiota bacterium]